jgi:hypothetical protein
MGPLLKHPDIVKAFRPAATVSTIPNVSVVDVVTTMRKLMRSSAKAGFKRMEPADIVSALVNDHFVSDPLELCVRMKGLGLYIKTTSDELRRESSQLARAQQDHRVQLEKIQYEHNAQMKRMQQEKAVELQRERQVSGMIAGVDSNPSQ